MSELLCILVSSSFYLIMNLGRGGQSGGIIISSLGSFGGAYLGINPLSLSGNDGGLRTAT